MNKWMCDVILMVMIMNINNDVIVIIMIKW